MSQYDTHGIQVGSIVRHFKREFVAGETSRYLYKVLAIGRHTETGEDLVVYQALYSNDNMGVHFGVYCRPAAMFFSEVDHFKYPASTSKWRFEVVE